MRKVQKNMLLELVKTFYEAHGVIKKHIGNNEIENAQNLLSECQSTAIQMGTIIEKCEGEGFVTVQFFEEYCEALFLVYQGVVEGMTDIKAFRILNKKIIQVESSIKSDIKVKLEIVFMPYKVSMWDSLESVWKAAAADSNCEAYVVPIPYYDRKSDGTAGTYHYEGDEYPEYVPVVSYDTYHLEKHRPDIIYIHNPYDEYNFVTSVDPRFYSKELKKYTEKLVYIPYHMTGFYDGFHTVSSNIPSAFGYVDAIVLPSFSQKEYFMSGGIPDEKMLVLGNPKTDFVVNELQNVDVPSEWLEKTCGKKVILLNSTVARVLSDENWGREMTDLLSVFENSESCFLIWRPHPLLEATISSMRPQKMEEFEGIVRKIKHCKNVIIDENTSVYPAMKISDAMISDYSSIVMQYSLTGKPALLTEGKSEYRKTHLICFDYFSNYFIEDGTTVHEFIKMVCSGSDNQKEERMKLIADSVVNIDGSCGVKIHNYILGIAQREE